MKRLLSQFNLIIIVALMFVAVMTPRDAAAETIKCRFQLTLPTQNQFCTKLDPNIGQFVTHYSNLSVNDIEVQVDAGSCQSDIRTIPKLTEDVPQSYQCGNITGAIFTHLYPLGTVEGKVSQ